VAQPYLFRGGGYDLPWVTALGVAGRSSRAHKVPHGERGKKLFAELRLLMRFLGSTRARKAISSVKTTHKVKAQRHKPQEVVRVVVDWHLRRAGPVVVVGHQ
jgi:hypothetical protein